MTRLLELAGDVLAWLHLYGAAAWCYGAAERRYLR